MNDGYDYEHIDPVDKVIAGIAGVLVAVLFTILFHI